MATEKQIAANRRNALKSTGPRSINGKARSRLNATRHGLTASSALLPDEDRAAFDDLVAGLYEHYQPRGDLERHLVDLIAAYLWRLKRVPAIEATIFGRKSQTGHAEEGLTIYTTSYALPANGTSAIEKADAKSHVQAEMPDVSQQTKAENKQLLSFIADPRNVEMLNKLARYEANLVRQFRRIHQHLVELQKGRLLEVDERD